VQSNRARAERGAGRLDQAEAAARQALTLREALGGTRGEEWFNSRAVLGAVWLDTGRAAEARDLFAASLAESRRLFPPDHPSLAQRHLALAEADVALGALDEARTHYEESLRIGLASAGEHALYVIQARLGLAETLQRLHDTAGSLRQREAVVEAVARLPEGHSLKRRASLLAAAR
jgi:serine/threonine-protein kinase